MTEQTPLEHGQLNRSNTSLPVPAARPLGDFSMERIGPDVVLFDLELNRYHTLNSVAFDIWRLCDGIRSADEIAESAKALPEVVGAAIEQLGESGLLEVSEESFESTMHRRKMVKLVAAGVIGAVGIPVVASITRVGPEASATDVKCDATHPCPPGKCCCQNRSGNRNCSDVTGPGTCAAGTCVA